MGIKSEVCEVAACGRVVWAYKLCNGHCRQWQRGEEFSDIRPYRLNTPHTCTLHQKGSTTCYNHCKCRCDTCRIANNNVRKRAFLRLRMVVNATGTRRRLQALAVMGYSLPEVAKSCASHPRHLAEIRAGRLANVSIQTARKVADAYTKLCMRAPTGSTPAARAQVIARARRSGWSGPLSWEDIDNPNEKPDEDAAPPSQRRPTSVDEILMLADSGENLGTIAQRLGVTDSAIEVRLRRAGHRSVANRLVRESRLPWVGVA